MAAEETEDKNPMTLPGRETIEAYISQAKMICLKQHSYPDGDNIISMLPTDIPIIIKWLNELVEQHKQIEIEEAIEAAQAGAPN